MICKNALWCDSVNWNNTPDTLFIEINQRLVDENKLEEL